MQLHSTYDPIKSLPDTFSFQHWDVYVDPYKNTVREYIPRKKMPGNKTQLLTWESGKSCNIKTVSSDSSGKVSIEKGGHIEMALLRMQEL